MAGTAKVATEKEVVRQNNRLSGALGTLKETAELLVERIAPITSVQPSGEGCGDNPEPEMCEHAYFIYKRALEVEHLNGYLRDIIERIEI